MNIQKFFGLVLFPILVLLSTKSFSETLNIYMEWEVEDLIYSPGNEIIRLEADFRFDEKVFSIPFSGSFDLTDGRFTIIYGACYLVAGGDTDLFCTGEVGTGKFDLEVDIENFFGVEIKIYGDGVANYGTGTVIDLQFK